MKYFVVTFGCQMNLSDSERISAVLESAKYKKTENINEANLVVVNACSVRQSAIDRIYGLVEKLSRLAGSRPGGKKITTILTGCVLKKDKRKFEEIFDYILDIKNLPNWPKIIKTHVSHILDDRSKYDTTNYLDITPKYSSKDTAYVPIMTGCNNFCAYCVVPYTRDREVSRPAKNILHEIKNLVNPASPKLRGAREIWLLGQNVNSYKDMSCTDDRHHKVIKFSDLLKRINDIPGDFEINFTSSHPKDFSDELIETMAKCKKLSRRLNLPIQSGDDEVLKKMNRPYTVAHYKNLVKKIRKAIPGILLSTDVIVGFPGETKKQFQNTVKALKEIKFGVAFINKYSPRAGTVAAKMEDDVPWQEKKRREKILIKLINAKYRYAKK